MLWGLPQATVSRVMFREMITNHFTYEIVLMKLLNSVLPFCFSVCLLFHEGMTAIVLRFVDWTHCIYLLNSIQLYNFGV